VSDFQEHRKTSSLPAASDEEITLASSYSSDARIKSAPCSDDPTDLCR